MSIDELVIKLGLDGAGLESGVKQAEGKLSWLNQRLQVFIKAYKEELKRIREEEAQREQPKPQETQHEQVKRQGQKDYEELLKGAMTAKTSLKVEEIFSKALKKSFDGVSLESFSKKLDMAFDMGLLNKRQKTEAAETEQAWKDGEVGDDSPEAKKIHQWIDEILKSKAPEIIAKLKEELDKATESAEQTEGQIKKIDDSTEKLGKKIGSKFGGLIGGAIKRFVLPLLAGLSLNSFFNSFSGDVKQVAQMTGYYTGQMDEWYKKRAMLARVTREDLELYRKSKFAVLNFNVALADLSSNIMHRLTPTFFKALDMLERFTAWVSRNENNIIRFVTVVAGVIAVALLPVLAKLAISGFLAIAPFLPWIAIIAAVILMIDDFVTYLQGGDSVIGKFADDVKNAFAQIPQVVETAFGKVKKWINGLIDDIKKIWKTILDGLAQVRDTPVFELVGKLKDFIVGKVTGNADDSEEKTQTDKQTAGQYPDVIPSAEAVTKGAVPTSVTNSQNVKGDTNINVGNVTVETQATDANGVAEGFVGGVEKAASDKFGGMPLTPAADGGVR